MDLFSWGFISPTVCNSNCSGGLISTRYSLSSRYSCSARARPSMATEINRISTPFSASSAPGAAAAGLRALGSKNRAGTVKHFHGFIQLGLYLAHRLQLKLFRRINKYQVFAVQSVLVFRQGATVNGHRNQPYIHSVQRQLGSRSGRRWVAAQIQVGRHLGGLAADIHTQVRAIDEVFRGAVIAQANSFWLRVSCRHK